MADFASTPVAVAVAATSSAVAWCCFHSPVTTYHQYLKPAFQQNLDITCKLDAYCEPVFLDQYHDTTKRFAEEQRPDVAEGLEVDIELGIDIA